MPEVTVTAASRRAHASDATVTASVGKSTDTAVEITDYTRVDDIRITIKSGETSGKGNFTLDKLEELVEIDLSGNNLSNNMSVNIPNQIGQLTALEKLDLSDNNLSGSPPSRWWGSLTKLKTLDLSGNEFSGTIPSRLRSISTLTDLDLSDNKFSGSIPGSLDRLTALKTLDISNNEITGTIPRRLGNLAGSGLTKFSFCGNYLRGSLPTAFRTGVDTPGIASSDYSNIAVCRISTP